MKFWKAAALLAGTLTAAEAGGTAYFYRQKDKKIIPYLIPLFRALNKVFAEDELNKIERKKYYDKIKKEENEEQTTIVYRCFLNKKFFYHF